MDITLNTQQRSHSVDCIHVFDLCGWKRPHTRTHTQIRHSGEWDVTWRHQRDV